MAARQVNDWTLSFHQMEDEDVVAFARSGSDRATEHLMSKYRGLVECKAKSYYLAGADRDDVIQEGMIGLFKAIRDYRGDRLARFRAFADLCVTRQIITAVKGATRKKHVPLQQYVSLQKKCNEDEGDGTLLDFLPDTQVIDPESVVMDRFMREAVREAAETELSELESTVLNRYLDGQSYEEMAADLSCRTKSIDNALQRVKRKIGERVLAKAG